MTVFFHAHIDELEYMLRIAIAALCGGIIGFERSRMRKEAGLRTHIIVAVGAALLMIVSKYGFTDMYSGGFYPFPTREEFWAYWSRYIYINRYQDAPKPVYGDFLPWGRGYLRARCFY